MRLLLALALALPGYAFAASGTDWSPPKPSGTTTNCKGALVWDTRKGKCVAPKQSSLDADGIFSAVRELAYAGRADDAQAVLAAMPDQNESRVLTYWGFTHRKLGHVSLANSYYEQAIAQDPDNLLARSYMGQGFAEAGEKAQAEKQLQEILDRGGRGSWPEVSLRRALETGQGYSH
ncbi:tetratricopeptide repeat protein [Roseobacteraceae bacterium NS-SX3]